MRADCLLKCVVLLALCSPSVSTAQVVTQLARENTKIPRGERHEDKPQHLTPVEVNVDTTSAYYVLIDSAQTMIDERRWAEAEQCIVRAIAAEPGHPTNSLLLSNLATLQRYQGRLDEAVKNYTMALDLTPNAVTLLLNRAAVFVQLGDNERAIGDYERVRQLDATEVESRYCLGMMAVEKLDYQQAEQLFDEIRRVQPRSGLAAEGMGMLYKSQGKFEKAIEQFDRVIGTQPDARLLANRADCCLATKRLNQAEEDIRLALSMMPSDPYLYVLRAKLNKLRFNRGDMERDMKLAAEHGLEPDLVEALLK